MNKLRVKINRFPNEAAKVQKCWDFGGNRLKLNNDELKP
jgi:hypothetical protein